jgi:hypothetical protein
VNGLLNRLSDQTKDPSLRALRALFDTNSTTVVTHVLKALVLKACANPTQIMTNLIPLYAVIIAGLHFTVGTDVGASIVEDLVTSLHTATKMARGEDQEVAHELIGNYTQNF